METILKSKIVFLMIFTGLLMASCGSSNDVVSGGLFSKRKYTNGYHSNMRKNLKSEEKDFISEALKENKNLPDETTIVKNDPIENRTVIVKPASVIPTSGIAENNSEIKDQNGPIKGSLLKNETSNESNFTINSDKNEKIAAIKDHAIRSANKSSYKSFKKTSLRQEDEINVLLNVILIIILVLIIASLLSFLGGPAGGWLSLLVFIFLVLLILRVFGLI